MNDRVVETTERIKVWAEIDNGQTIKVFDLPYTPAYVSFVEHAAYLSTLRLRDDCNIIKNFEEEMKADMYQDEYIAMRGY